MTPRWLKLAILLVVPLFVTGCGLRQPKKKSPSPSPSATAAASAATAAGVNYFTVDPQSVDEAIQANYQQAEQKVKAWKADAVLYHVAAKLPADLSVGQATEVYTYGSPTDAYNWWTYNVSGRSGKSVRAIIPKEDYLGTDLQLAPVRFWKINYVEALQLADSHGGADFRANHSDATVSINLLVNQPKNYLWWSVEYQAATSEPYKILVNPSTKEVYTEAGELLSQPAATTGETTPTKATTDETTVIE